MVRMVRSSVWAIVFLVVLSAPAPSVAKSPRAPAGAKRGSAVPKRARDVALSEAECSLDDYEEESECEADYDEDDEGEEDFDEDEEDFDEAEEADGLDDGSINKWVLGKVDSLRDRLPDGDTVVAASKDMKSTLASRARTAFREIKGQHSFEVRARSRPPHHPAARVHRPDSWHSFQPPPPTPPHHPRAAAARPPPPP